MSLHGELGKPFSPKLVIAAAEDATNKGESMELVAKINSESAGEHPFLTFLGDAVRELMELPESNPDELKEIAARLGENPGMAAAERPDVFNIGASTAITAYRNAISRYALLLSAQESEAEEKRS
jgi:hypothetical protein